MRHQGRNDCARILRRIEILLSFIPLASLRYPRVTVALWILVTLLALFPLLGVRRVVSLNQLIKDSDFSTFHANERITRHFPPTQSVFVLFERRDGLPFEEDDLCVLRDWLPETASSIDGVRAVRSPFDLRAPRRTEDKLHYPELVPLSCATEGPNRQTTPSLLSPLRGSPWVGLFVGRDENALAAEFLLHESAPGAELPFEVAALDGLQRRLDTTFGPPEEAGGTSTDPRSCSTDSCPRLRASLSGTATWTWYFLRALDRASLLNGLVLVVILTGFRLLYGSWKGGLLLTMTLAMTGILTYGAMGGVGHPIDSLTNSLFLMIVVAAAQDFLFLSQRQLERPRAWKSLSLRFLAPCFFTSFTTALGFGSLVFTDLDPLRRFGLWAAFGALTEWLVTFSFLPALGALHRNFRVWTDADRVKAYFRAPHGLISWTPSRAVVRVAFASALVGMSGVFFFNVSDAPQDIFPASHPLPQDADRIQERLGWRAPLNLLAVDKDVSRALAAELRNQRNVVVIDDPLGQEDELLRGLSPLTADLVRREVKHGGGLGRESRSPTGEVLLRVFVRESDTTSLAPLRAFLQTRCGEPDDPCAVGGEIIALAEFTDRVISALLESLAVSLLLVGAVLLGLCYALRRTWRETGALVAASLWGPFVMPALLALTQIRINFVTCVFASVLVGLAGDNAIQFLFGSRGRPLTTGLDHRGEGSVQNTVLMLLGTLCFLVSPFAPPRILGLLLGAGFLGFLAGDLWLLRALLTGRSARNPFPRSGPIPEDSCPR